MLLHDPEQIVELVAGQLGATGLTASAKTAEGHDAVALSSDKDLLAIRLAPGALFQPDGEQYASTRLRPQVSPTIKGRPGLARIAEACRDQSLRFRLRLSVLHDAAIAARHPDAARCSPVSLSSTNWLCPSNADVVELVRCQLLDLADQFQPDGIELENFAPPDHLESTSPSCFWPAEPGAVELALLAICFCPSCRQQAIHAGVDASLALRSVQVYLKSWLESEKPRPGTMDDLLANDEILAGYVGRQREVLLSALQIWTHAVPNVSLVAAGDCAGSPWNPSYEELVAAAPRLTLATTPENCLEQCTQAAAGSSDTTELEVTIDAASPSFAAGPDIVRCLGDLARAKVAGVTLENGLGVSPARRPFIRQAIRIARRERSL